jgi:hypothetical protein
MSFYDQLSPVDHLDDALDPARYRSAPDDWHLALTDIEGSTVAIERGLQKSVNMIAASCIAAVRNICTGMEVPYLFGGDGATLLIPPEHADQALAALSGVRAFVKSNSGLNLRVGAIRVGDLRTHGHDVMVARYEASPGNSFAMFRGGGVGFLDLVLKGRHPTVSTAIVQLPEAVETPDLSGLSCLWEPIASKNGCMVSLVAAMPSSDGDYRPILRRLIEIAGNEAQPASPEALETTLRRKWLPSREAMDMEVAASGAESPLQRLRVRLGVILVAAAAQFSVRLGIGIGPVNAGRYIRESARNSDFCKVDGALQMVMDCTPAALAQIETYLIELESTGRVSFGLHVSDSAVMTCLVKSFSEGHHVHFIDGAGGGYTKAAQVMKSKLQPAAA